MNVLEELRLKFKPGQHTYIRMTPGKFLEYLSATSSMMRFIDSGSGGRVTRMYMGALVSPEPFSAYCRNCGAPAEPDVCSFCKSPSEYILLG